jgi:hypothetical protein
LGFSTRVSVELSFKRLGKGTERDPLLGSQYEPPPLTSLGQILGGEPMSWALFSDQEIDFYYFISSKMQVTD